jgi:uncharacterized cupredoxin-like copper-binding protein
MNPRMLTATALLMLAVAACGSSASASTAASTPGAASASSSASTSATAGESSPVATSITERDFMFDTPDVTVAGSAVSLAVTNAGPTIHDLTIRDESGKVLGETEDLKAGASETLTVPLQAGKYVIFCSLPGHESLGLKGTLTVTP